MEPTGLTHGNWIKIPNGEHVVVDFIAISRGKYVVHYLPNIYSSGNGMGSCHLRYCEPILLNSYTLILAGFVRVYTTKFLFAKTNYFVNYHIAFSEDLQETFVYDEQPNLGVKIPTIKYIHELQNICKLVEKKDLLIIFLDKPFANA